jgi:imidazolonepropionase-like amidohydrolase
MSFLSTMQPMKHLSLGLLFAGALAAQDVVAVKAGRVITMAGPDLENATVLIENGRIKAIGKDVEVPWNAKVIEAADKTVMPTWVLAHQSGGLYGGGNENLQNVPYLTVGDALDPSSEFFEDALRNGVGTIHVVPTHRTLIGGQGMVVRPFGRTVADMTVQTRSVLKLSLLGSPGTSRTNQIQRLRRALEEVAEHVQDFERRKQEFAKEQAAGVQPADKTFDEELDKTKKPVAELLAGKRRAHLYVPGPAELPEALRLATQHAFETVLVLGARCHKSAATLKNTKHPVVLDAQVEVRETDPETDVETVVCPAAVLGKLGVPFALSLEDQARGSAPGRYPWWQMGVAMRHGLDRATALAAFTTVPSRILELQDQVGTLEVGKLGNLQILTGDPLKATTWVDKVVLDGQLVYEREKDPRLEHLLGQDRAKAARPEPARKTSEN